jgi:hypothetical protein
VSIPGNDSVLTCHSRILSYLKVLLRRSPALFMEE